MKINSQIAPFPKFLPNLWISPKTFTPLSSFTFTKIMWCIKWNKIPLLTVVLWKDKLSLLTGTTLFDSEHHIHPECIGVSFLRHEFTPLLKGTYLNLLGVIRGIANHFKNCNLKLRKRFWGNWGKCWAVPTSDWDAVGEELFGFYRETLSSITLLLLA